MRLPGKLDATTLGDLLGALHRAQASGVLELIESVGAASGRVHRVHFDAGLVREVETSSRVARLGELLRREGFVGDEALRRLARRLFEEPLKRAGELLVEDGSLTPMALRAALRRQLRDRLEALFSLREAFVRFRVARHRVFDADALPLSPREFLHGRARRRRVRERPVAPSDSRRAALELLGLPRDADRAAVQRAFRKLAASVHPDRHPGVGADEKARLMQRFAELSAAYHALVA